MAFLRSFGPLGFEIHIFCCYTLCLVYLAWQRARQPISATRDFSVQKPEGSGRISSGRSPHAFFSVGPTVRIASVRRFAALLLPAGPPTLSLASGPPSASLRYAASRPLLLPAGPPTLRQFWPLLRCSWRP